MNNRIVGIAGSALLIIGVFLPILSLFILSLSLWSFITGSLPPGGGDDIPLGLFRIIGIVILLLGIGSLLLALKNQFKPLIATGVIALALLVFLFIKLQSFLSTAPEQARSLVGVGWGLYVMALGAIALIVAAVMKSPVAARAGDWTGSAPPPPPPPPYTPGR